MTTITTARPAAPNPPPRPAKRGKRSPYRPFVVPLIVLLVGLIVLAYPVVATQWNNYRAMRQAKSVATVMDSLSPVEKAQLVDRARAYNARLGNGGPSYDPWTKRPDTSTPEYKDYESQLAVTDAMGQLVIPSIKVDLPIFHGTDDAVLDKGVGHLYGSSLPVGGKGTHAVLTAHTGFNDQTLFDNLKDLKKGDSFFVKSVAGPLKYVVDQIRVVLPENTKDLRIDPTQDYVTLVTCTPYGINSHRLLVRGHRVPFSPASDQASLDRATGLVWQWWMVAVLGAIAAILLVLVLLVVSAARRRRRAASRSGGAHRATS